MRPWLYSALYRLKVAPWDALRPEIVALVQDGREAPASGARAVDLGCGTGLEAVYLAQHGYQVTGVDYTPIALRRARRRAAQAGVADRCTFLHADITSPATLAGEQGYDLIVDCGTLDDLSPEQRPAMAETIRRLSRPGSVFVLWCFYSRSDELPAPRWSGASRMLTAIAPGEEKELFGDNFDIERLPEPPPPEHCACFVMTRR